MQMHEVIETRQVFELPKLRVRVIAHQQIRSTCACGAAHAGAWPPGVNASAQYGASVKAMAVNFQPRSPGTTGAHQRPRGRPLRPGPVTVQHPELCPKRGAYPGLISYKDLDCTHGVCNAAHLRELVYVHEQENEKVWDSSANAMGQLLVRGLRGSRSGAEHVKGQAKNIGLLQDQAQSRYLLHDPLVPGNHDQTKGKFV